MYEAAQLAQAEEREAIAKQRAIDAEERQRESENRRRAQGDLLALRLSNISTDLRVLQSY